MEKRAYYNSIFLRQLHHRWEKAPGKDVIICALKHYYEMGRIPKRAKVIDIGCGTGFLLNRILSEVSTDFELYGVDFAESAISKGKALYPKIFLFCEDGLATHFADGSFDILISYGTYEHFEDPRKGIVEAARILRKKGIFLGMIPTLGIDRTDRDDEGWYEQKPIEGSPFRQMQ